VNIEEAWSEACLGKNYNTLPEKETTRKKGWMHGLSD
jgi:hypothetical protein